MIPTLALRRASVEGSAAALPTDPGSPDRLSGFALFAGRAQAPFG